MKTVRLTTAQAMAQWLLAQRTEIDGEEVPLFPGVFGIFGHGNVTSLAEALYPYRDTLPMWRGQNEQSMALAAIAFAKARLRRQIMIAVSSVGPGSTNMVTAAAVAHANRLPVLLMSGDYFTHRVVDPVLQQVEDFFDPTISVSDTFKPVTRYWDRITHPKQIIASLPQAVATMLDPATAGPAYLGLPQDVQAEAADYPEAFFEPRLHQIRRPGPDPSEVTAAGAVLREAEKPLIIAGGGVRYSQAIPEVTGLAERRRIPIVETVAGKSTLVADHPNFGGPIGVTGSTVANELASQCDVVLAVGTRLQDFTTGSWAIFSNPDARFVSVNTTSWDARKRGATAVVGDAKVTISRLDEELGDITYPSSWLATAQDGMRKWRESLQVWDERRDLYPPAYAQVIRTINQICDPDTYVVSASGGLPGELNMGWHSKEVNTFDCEYGFSTMGYEIGGGWGAKMARPDSEVVVWVGDGSYLMANSDVYSSVFAGHKLIVLVLDNGGFGVINRLQMDQGGEEWNNLFRDSRHEKMFRVDFVKHLESMGAFAERVRTLDELPDAYRRAQQSDQTYGIVMDVHEYEWTDGGAWWEVGVPEVSDHPKVRAAREAFEEAKKEQRPG